MEKGETDVLPAVAEAVAAIAIDDDNSDPEPTDGTHGAATAAAATAPLQESVSKTVQDVLKTKLCRYVPPLNTAVCNELTE